MENKKNMVLFLMLSAIIYCQEDIFNSSASDKLAQSKAPLFSMGVLINNNGS